MSEVKPQMTEQMQAALEWAIRQAEFEGEMAGKGSCLSPLFDAGEHVEGLKLLRQDYGQMAGARDAAIELLADFRDRDFGDLGYPVTFSTGGGSTVRLCEEECQRITEVIGLLDGSAKEEGNDEAE